MDFSPLWISLKVAFLATMISMILGIAAARFVVKLRYGKGLFDGLFTLPMIMPPTVAGFFLLLLLGNHGWIGKWLSVLDISLIFTWGAAVLASCIVSFPLMYRTVRGALEGVDQDIVHAARTLGISERHIFWKIIIPNIVPSIMAGTILSFARALGEFGATIMIAGNIPGKTQTMSIAVYSAVQAGNRDLAYLWVIIICLISFTSIMLLNYVNRRLGIKQKKAGIS